MFKRLFLAGCLVLPLASAAKADTIDTRAVVQGAIEHFVRPGYQRFHQAAGGLNEATESLCKTPSAEHLASARQAFSETVDAWSRVEILRLGPVMDDHRLERILFWPDRKSIGLRQVQAVLAEKDESASTVERIAEKSVAAQGLGALEFVLFGTGAETLEGTAEPFRCTYGLAITGNLNAMAGELQAAWDDPQGFAAIWANPGPDNRLYRNDKEALGELVDVMVQGLEFVRDVRLKAFLRDTAEQDKPRLAAFRRSEKTLDSLRENMDAMRSLFEESGFAAALPAEGRETAKSILFEFSNAARALDLPKQPLEELLKDRAARDKLTYFRIVTSSLTKLIGTDLSGALGLSAGFSSLDGD
ncbi:MAG: imelysin family protein [Phyllobacterium sp.]